MPSVRSGKLIAISDIFLSVCTAGGIVLVEHNTAFFKWGVRSWPFKPCTIDKWLLKFMTLGRWHTGHTCIYLYGILKICYGDRCVLTHFPPPLPHGDRCVLTHFPPPLPHFSSSFLFFPPPLYASSSSFLLPPPFLPPQTPLFGGIQWGYSGDTVRRIQWGYSVTLRLRHPPPPSPSAATVTTNHPPPSPAAGLRRHLSLEGYSEDTVRIQWGYSEDTVRIQHHPPAATAHHPPPSTAAATTHPLLPLFEGIQWGYSEDKHHTQPLRLCHPPPPSPSATLRPHHPPLPPPPSAAALHHRPSAAAQHSLPLPSAVAGQPLLDTQSNIHTVCWNSRKRIMKDQCCPSNILWSVRGLFWLVSYFSSNFLSSDWSVMTSLRNVSKLVYTSQLVLADEVIFLSSNWSVIFNLWHHSFF